MTTMVDVPIHWIEALNALARRGARRNSTVKEVEDVPSPKGSGARQGTFVSTHNANWLIREVGEDVPLTIWVWRSVTVRFLRTFVHGRRGGRGLLRLLFWLEERFPHFFGKYGQYPLIEIQKV